MFQRLVFLVCSILLLLQAPLRAAAEQTCASAKYESKTRVFVLTDIGNEPDDQMSLVRFLTYSNELDVQGIVATTSTWLSNTTNEDTILTILDSYEEVVANLTANAQSSAGAYPSADYLRSITSHGKPVYGLEALNGSLSDGAKLLIEAVNNSDEPLWVTIWSGASVLAEALNYVSANSSSCTIDEFVSKIRVYSISDQDDAGAWIRLHYPEMIYIASLHAFDAYYVASWTGISGEEYYYFDPNGPDTSLVTNEWLQENIRIGPLGDHYLDYAYIMEGDTPSFLYLIPNGLGEPDHPEYGSWGGRYWLTDTSGNSGSYSNSVDQVVGKSGDNYTSAQATIWRWRQDYQYDFAARMNYSVNGNFSEANHAPVAIVNGTCGPNSISYSMQANESITFDASESWDPDNDELSFEWIHYQNAGNDSNIGRLFNSGSYLDIAADSSTATFTPTYAPAAYHVILKVSDQREKPLVAYRRIILEVVDDD